MTKTFHTFVQSTAFDKDNNEEVLAAQEFSWSVLQVVPTPVEKHDAIIEHLKETYWISLVNRRKDLIIFHTGSVGKCRICRWVPLRHHLLRPRLGFY